MLRFTVLVLIGLLLTGCGAVQPATEPPGAPVQQTASPGASGGPAGRYVLGQPDAKVTIEEYADFQ